VTLATAVTCRLRTAGLDPAGVERVIRAALEEDLRYGPDVTSAATAPAGAWATAEVVARAPGVLAGLPVALAVLDAAGIPAAAGEAGAAGVGEAGAAGAGAAAGSAVEDTCPVSPPPPGPGPTRWPAPDARSATPGRPCPVFASSRSTRCAAAAASTTGWGWATPR